MVRKISILVVCFSIGVLGKTMAQESNLSQAQQDSIMNARQDSIMNARIKSDAEYQVKVNAMEYSMQKRYRPTYKEFANNKFIDNLYISLWGGVNGLFSRANYKMNGGSEVGISATKFFSPYNAVRLSGVKNDGRRKLDNESWSSLGVLADHLFNITTYADGFDPGRLLELSTVEGFGIHRSSLGGKKDYAIDLHLGAQLKVHTGTRLDFFFEPRISLFSDQIDLSGDENWHKYDVGYSAYVGMSYRLGASYKNDTIPEESFLENTFVSFSQGMQMQSSAMAREVGFLKAVGPSMSVSAGKWLLDYFGLRLSVFGAYNSWKLDREKEVDKLSAYGGGRLEAMLNPYAFFSEDVRSVNWGVIPMIGVEAGMMKKQDDKALISKSYAALTAGVQFKYYVDKNFALFFEPRFSSVPYSFSEKNYIGKVEETSFSDALWTLSLGVEVRNPLKDDRKQLREHKSTFTPYYYSSMGLGLAYPVQTKRYHNRRAGYSLNAALGRQITPVSGIRIGADVNNMYSWSSATGVLPRSYLTGSLDYTFDVTNFISGYDPERKWYAELFGGFVGTVTTGEGKKINLGVEGGGRLGLQVYDYFGFYAEPKFRFYSKSFIPNGAAGATRMQMNLSVGTTYRFGSNYRNAAASSGFGDGTILGNTFISLSEGVQNTAGNLKGTGIGRVRAAGPTINVAVGKWLVDFFGLRFSAFASSHSYARADVRTGRNALAAYGGGRIEGMLNPIALFAAGDEKPRWGIVPMAGLEVGMLAKQQPTGAFKKKYAALTGGLQLKYYVTDHMAVFVEPHASRIPYSVTRKGVSGLETSMVADNLLSFSVGVELSRLAGLTKSKLGLDKVSFEPYNFASVALGAGLPVSIARYDTQKMGAMFGVAAGRQLSPYSAARVGLEYMSLSTKYGNKDHTFSYTSLALDYMLSLSNVMAGYDEQRAFGTDLFVGPLYSFGLNGGGSNLGLEAGARVYYKMSNGFDLYAEPKFRTYFGDFMKYKYSTTTPLMMSFSLGTTYRF